ncbi:MAG: hypothetical protein QXO54_02270 [Candidatus Methanomethylicaceae archaeon]|nr:hypothetical protein [Candidatus Verstraetearchaeota archaeon]
MGKFNGGQAEIVLIIPLLFCVLLLNSAMIGFLENKMDALRDIRRSFEDLAFGYFYFTDPASGNQYPMVVNRTMPQLEG